MLRKITLDKTADLLKTHDCIEILTHNYPDGDTIGSSFALCLALQSLGKNARIITSGDIPPKFAVFGRKIKAQSFEPQYIISTDVAALSLLGENEKSYSDRIDLCIDHHGSNSIIAKNSYIDASAAATGEIIFELIKLLKVEIDKDIAEALYLAISTDTGCFRYGNTTSRTLRICAELLDKGVDNGGINYSIFDEKSPEKVMLEKKVYDTLTYFCNGQGAMIIVSKAMLDELNIDDSETEGLASIPRQIEGVKIGMTLREKRDGTYKISVRTNREVNACEFCSLFGGGGHPAASGCSIKGTLEEVKTKLIRAAEEFL